MGHPTQVPTRKGKRGLRLAGLCCSVWGLAPLPPPSSTTLKVFYLHGFPLLGTWMCHVACKGRSSPWSATDGPNPRSGEKTGIPWTTTLLTRVDRVTRAEDSPKSSLDSERAPTPNLQAAAPRKVHQQTVRVSWWALGFAFPRRHLDTGGSCLPTQRSPTKELEDFRQVSLVQTGPVPGKHLGQATRDLSSGMLLIAKFAHGVCRKTRPCISLLMMTVLLMYVLVLDSCSA